LFQDNIAEKAKTVDEFKPAISGEDHPLRSALTALPS
jgi:hypothetical protein